MTSYPTSRHWLLHQLLRVWACREVGSMSAATALRERRTLQRRMVELRKERYGK
jgi:hypothetical protein